jgi:hypothetical protein
MKALFQMRDDDDVRTPFADEGVEVSRPMTTPPVLAIVEVTQQPAEDFGNWRGFPRQGRALQMLGHAAEYLLDLRMFAVRESSERDDLEAIQILMRLSRAVFAECPEMLPQGHRI